MSDVSTLRVYLFRAMHLLLAVSLGLTIWPGILAPGNASHMGASLPRELEQKEGKHLASRACWGLWL